MCMKLTKKVFLFVCILNSYSHLYLDSPPGIPTADAHSWLASAPVSEEHERLIQSVSSYPAVGIIKTETGAIAQQMIQNRTIKATTPPHTVPILQKANFSVLRAKGHECQNYPTGNTLFKNYPEVAQKFDSLINALIKEPKFLTFFRKVHLNILNELYKYLMNIYTNFNLQHVGIKEVQNAEGQTALQINISAFLQDEAIYESNKKTLIINHLVNIIESQLNGAVRSVMPTIPHTYATYAGKTLIQNDYSIDLTDFILKQVDADLVNYKQAYLQALATYLDFFNTYTSYLNQPHPTKAEHFTAFLDIAESINQYLHGSKTITNQSSQEEKTKELLDKMDPPMFTFSYDDIRALKLIPHVAKSLPQNTKAILWPKHIMDAANNIVMIDGHPMAYFKDAAGNIVHEAEATRLFIIMQSGKNLFEEELLAQPEWLNSWEGVMRVLRGCFGDFSALPGLGILDPCMETLIANTIGTLQGKNVNEENSVENICQAYLDSLKKEPVQVPEAKKTALQSLSTVLPEATSTPSLQLKPTKKSIIKLSPSSDDISSLSPSAQDISPALTQ